MKRALPMLVAALLVLFSAVSSSAAPSPVVLTHAVTSSTEGGRVTAFSIHVDNVGDSAISKLTLSFVARPPFVKTETILSVADLGPHQGVDLPAKLRSLAPVGSSDAASRSALFFTVSYVGADGRPVAFPAVSRLRPEERLKGETQAKLALQPAKAHPAPGAQGQYLLQWGAKYHFANPYGIAVDTRGNVYVADSDHNLIQKFDSKGHFVLSWGDFGSVDDRIYNPTGIAVDGRGNVYVADTYNKRIGKFDSNGRLLASWSSFDNGNVQFTYPTGVAVGNNGNIYVADGTRIVKLDSNGGLLAVWDNLGSDDGSPFYAFGIAVARDGDVYATSPINSTVHKFDSSGNLLLAWPVSGFSFNHAWGIATGRTGKVYVTNSDAIQVFDSSGNLLSTFGSYGTGIGQFQFPGALAVDRAGKIYVADTYNERVQIFSFSGTFLAAWASYGSEDGIFNYPQGSAVDPSGNVYVADTFNHRIQKFDRSGKFLMKWGTEGTADGQFQYPVDVATDGSGNVYVIDGGNHRIEKFDSTGTFLTAFHYSKWLYFGPNGITLDRDGNIYIADLDYQLVEKFDNNGNLLWESTGCYSPRDVGFFPKDVAVDASGNVYATDEITHDILKLDSYGNCISPFHSFFEVASGVAADESGDVYGSDSEGDIIKLFDLDGHFRASWGGYGVGDGQFIIPTYIATDNPGSVVYVTDTGNNRIQAFRGYGTTRFAVSAPLLASAGAPFSFKITALDALGQTVTGYTGVVKFVSSDHSATLPGETALSAGTGTFDATLRTPGIQTITAMDILTPFVKGTSLIAITGHHRVPDRTLQRP